VSILVVLLALKTTHGVLGTVDLTFDDETIYLEAARWAGKRFLPLADSSPLYPLWSRARSTLQPDPVCLYSIAEALRESPSAFAWHLRRDLSTLPWAARELLRPLAFVPRSIAEGLIVLTIVVRRRARGARRPRPDAPSTRAHRPRARRLAAAAAPARRDHGGLDDERVTPWEKNAPFWRFVHERRVGVVVLNWRLRGDPRFAGDPEFVAFDRGTGPREDFERVAVPGTTAVLAVRRSVPRAD
jgi:hypothetical protein